MGGVSTPYNQNSWKYDEENTPGSSMKFSSGIELKTMPKEQAMKNVDMKESSMQNHYMSASTYGGGAGSRPYT